MGTDNFQMLGAGWERQVGGGGGGGCCDGLANIQRGEEILLRLLHATTTTGLMSHYNGPLYA